jgi:hypothetical protein
MPTTMLLMSGRERACLDVTRGHDELYLGTYVANSIEQANTVLPTPRTVPVRGAC